MFRPLALASLIALTATSASALTISNLDDKTHRVIQESTPGSKVVRTIDPGQSIHTLQHGGEVYIEGSKHRIHINPSDLLVIWKDGNLQIQKRRKVGGEVF